MPEGYIPRVLYRDHRGHLTVCWIDALNNIDIGRPERACPDGVDPADFGVPEPVSPAPRTASRVGHRTGRRVDAAHQSPATARVGDPQRAHAENYPGGAEADPDGRPADAVGPRVDANDDAWTFLGHGHPDQAVGDRDPDGGRLQTDEGRDAVGPRVDAVDAGMAACAGRPDRARASSDAAELADAVGRDGGYGLGGDRVNAIDHTRADDPHS